eukprot:gene10311-21513_t
MFKYLILCIFFYGRECTEIGDATLNDDYRTFLTVYKSHVEHCSKKSINQVLQRHDKLYKDLTLERPWSVNNCTFTKFQSFKYCKSTKELSKSLKYGKRHFLDTPNQSYFISDSCNIHWYSEQESCNILNKFSHIYMFGNSLLRHETQALLMLLSKDWTHGALPGFDSNTEIFQKCQCDGQFSENLLCRPYSHTKGMKMNLIHPNNLCKSQNFELQYDASLKDNLKSSCTNDTRPRFVYYLFGSGKETDPDEVKNQLRSFIREILTIKKKCPYSYNIHFLYSGLTSQAQFMDALFPHQKREISTIFNMELHNFVYNFQKFENENIANENISIGYFDFLNLTQNAPTSDGYHFLTDVNMLRSMYFLNYLDLLTL